MNEENNIIISSKQKHFWQFVVAAFLFTTAIALIWLGCSRMTHPNLYTRDEYRNSIIIIEIAIFPLLFAFVFSLNMKIQIDTKSKEIKEIYSLGDFSFKLKSKIKNLEYISVFLNNEVYFLMMWYENNKHESLCGFNDFASAMEYAKEIANKLNIDLLDATEKGNFKWVDKT